MYIPRPKFISAKYKKTRVKDLRFPIFKLALNKHNLITPH